MPATVWSWALAAMILAMLIAGPANSGSAVEHPAHASAGRADERAGGEPYFVEFRARRGALLGHTFIAYGRLGAHGERLDVSYAGNYPADGQMGLIFGMVIPVPTIIGAVRGDFTDPVTNIYRRKLTAAQFARLKAAIRHVRSTEHYWHLMFFNCNDFAVQMTRWIGLRSPSPWLLPHDFVSALRELNSPDQ